jgi:cytochrome c-type biogenesis protein CcmH/NrfG
MMQSQRTEGARAAFSKIASEHPDQAEPHVFLARLARNDGDINTARQELATAIRLEPGNGRAQREMGLLLLGQNDPDLARRFLIRAVQLDTADHAAQGYLGCTLLRLGRIEEGQRFISRAGSGSWSACTAVPTGQAPGAGAPRITQP